MTIYHYLFIVAEMIALALIPVILIQRKEPTSTFAWILSLLFLPLLGVFLFLLFGRTRIRDRPTKDEPTDLDHAVPGPTPSEHAEAGKTVLERDCYRVAASLTHMPATGKNAIRVLIDGDQTYEAIGAAMDAAQHQIHAEYYLIHDDKVGKWFGERLAAAARRGVAVRLIKDGYGSFPLGRRWEREVTSSGVQVRTFLPMRSILMTPASLRNHRKIVVVDGTIGFTGGINICDEHSRAHSGANSWRDVHLRLEGPAVAHLHRVFLADWFYITNEHLPLPDVTAANATPGAARVAIVPNGPDTHTEAIHRVFFTAIAGATTEVLITSPYFGPDDTILVALEVAALRGVAVTLIVPARSNHRVTFNAGRSLYERLLEAGVHIYEYQPGMIHAKTLLIDRRLALVGSSNMDLRSFRLNFEVHALVEDRDASAQLYESMQQDLGNSIQIKPEVWRNRGLRARLTEGASRLVSPLL